MTGQPYEPSQAGDPNEARLSFPTSSAQATEILALLPSDLAPCYVRRDFVWHKGDIEDQPASSSPPLVCKFYVRIPRFDQLRLAHHWNSHGRCNGFPNGLHSSLLGWYVQEIGTTDDAIEEA